MVENNNNNGMYNASNNFGRSPEMMQNKSSGYGLWLGLGIFQLLCCNLIFGILTVVFACIANGKFNNNELEAHKKFMKLSKIMFFVGLLLTLIAVIWLVCFTGYAINENAYIPHNVYAY